MKKLSLVILAMLISLSAFAAKVPERTLIDAEIADDYEKFEQLVNTKKTKLDQKTSFGLNIQCALAYFSTENFQKACKLLSSKKVNLDEPLKNNMSLIHFLAYANDYDKIKILLEYKPDLNRRDSSSGFAPIDFTQLSTYKFVTSQQIDPETIKRSEKCRELLLSAGSPEFNYCEAKFQNVGNFFFCLCQLAVTYNRNLTPKSLNSPDYFDVSKENGRTVATFKISKVPDLFEYAGLKSEVEVHTDSSKFIEVIRDRTRSEDVYFCIGQTGKSPIAPYQWVCMNGIKNLDEVLSNNSDIVVSNPDSRFGCAEFKMKDFSQLITIKLIEKKN